MKNNFAQFVPIIQPLLKFSLQISVSYYKLKPSSGINLGGM